MRSAVRRPFVTPISDIDLGGRTVAELSSSLSMGVPAAAPPFRAIQACLSPEARHLRGLTFTRPAAHVALAAPLSAIGGLWKRATEPRRLARGGGVPDSNPTVVKFSGSRGEAGAAARRRIDNWTILGSQPAATSSRYGLEYPVASLGLSLSRCAHWRAGRQRAPPSAMDGAILMATSSRYGHVGQAGIAGDGVRPEQEDLRDHRSVAQPPIEGEHPLRVTVLRGIELNGA
jgi:hypothetical protein